MLEIMSRDNVSGEDYDRLTMSLSTNSVAMDELVNILVSTNLSRIMLSGQESMLVRAGESVVLRQLDHFVPSLIILDLLCAYRYLLRDEQRTVGRVLHRNCLYNIARVCLLVRMLVIDWLIGHGAGMGQ